MLICRVIGSAVSSVKHQSLDSFKLLIVQEVTVNNELKTEGPFVAVDMVGAGLDEVVLVVQGSNSCADGSMATAQKRIPMDASIVGIVDNLSVNDKFTFKK
jgi:ethanolamine utilization protein EutN